MSVDAFLKKYIISSDTPIDFNHFYQSSTYRNLNFLRSRHAADEKKYTDYRYKTVGEYKANKNYPNSNSKDRRPLKFNPLSDNMGAHGTNFDSILNCIFNTNSQLVPMIKQVKLQGRGPSVGERSSALNIHNVSTVRLKCSDNSFRDVIDYAMLAGRTGNSLSNADIFSCMPVVVIGDGVDSVPVNGIPDEVGYSRLNIRS